MVAGEHSSAAAIWRALREFCDIPKGELYISREEAEGIRVALLSHYISSQLPVHRDRQEPRHHPGHRHGARPHHRARRLPGQARRQVRGDDRGAEDPAAHPLRAGSRVREVHRGSRHLVHQLRASCPISSTATISTGFTRTSTVTGTAIDEEYKRVGGLFEKASFPPGRRGGVPLPDPPDRRAPHHRALLQLPGGQLRPGFLGKVPVHLPGQPGRTRTRAWPPSSAG